MYVQSGSPLENYAARMNGVSVPVVEKDGTYLVEVPLLQAGEVRLDFSIMEESIHMLTCW